MLCDRSEEAPFERNSQHYKCCKLNIKTGTYIIAWFELFLIITNLICKAVGFLETEWNWELLFLFVDLVAVTSLLYGITRERAAFLQPFVVLNVMTISLLILLTLFFISASIDQQSYAGEYAEMELRESAQLLAKFFHVDQKLVVPLFGGVSAGFIGIATLVHMYFFNVIVHCARYFRDIERNHQETDGLNNCSDSQQDDVEESSQLSSGSI